MPTENVMTIMKHMIYVWEKLGHIIDRGGHRWRLTVRLHGYTYVLFKYGRVMLVSSLVFVQRKICCHVLIMFLQLFRLRHNLEVCTVTVTLQSSKRKYSIISC